MMKFDYNFMEWCKKNKLNVKPTDWPPRATFGQALEDKLYDSKKINFHPLVNTATVTISTSDFVGFMVENKKKINIFSLENYKIIKIL